LILGMVLAGVTACTGQRPPGSMPEIERTKLGDVVGSAVGRVVLDATPAILIGKTLRIQVDISVGGGTEVLRRNLPTASATPEPTTCSKAIAALLE